MRPCARRVHRSLLQRELMAGIPRVGMVGLFVMAIMCVYAFKMYFMVVPIAVLYLVMRFLTARDPWLIDIVIDSIQQKDIFIP